MDERLFQQVFSDAHVVDVDLSEWDKTVDLYVLADHLEWVRSRRKPLVRVRFVKVVSLNMEVDLSDVRDDLGEFDHVQWWIDDFRLTRMDELFHITFSGLRSSPRLTVVCESVDIIPMDIECLDRLFPGWNRPARGLARPGIHKLVSRAGGGEHSP